VSTQKSQKNVYNENISNLYNPYISNNFRYTHTKQEYTSQILNNQNFLPVDYHNYNNYRVFRCCKKLTPTKPNNNNIQEDISDIKLKDNNLNILHSNLSTNTSPIKKYYTPQKYN
jgi:hypothetical protein